MRVKYKDMTQVPLTLLSLFPLPQPTHPIQRQSVMLNFLIIVYLLYHTHLGFLAFKILSLKNKNLKKKKINKKKKIEKISFFEKIFKEHFSKNTMAN